MKAFLDTNVIIDFYAQRESFFRPAAIILPFSHVSAAKLQIKIERTKKKGEKLASCSLIL